MVKSLIRTAQACEGVSCACSWTERDVHITEFQQLAMLRALEPQLGKETGLRRTARGFAANWGCGRFCRHCGVLYA